MQSRTRERLEVGVDTGGTFTDVVYRRADGRSGWCKLLSTPDDPGRAVLEALARLFDGRPPDRISYGTTIATNAMLQRQGARTALVTTAGFEDLLEIGRQARPGLYDLEPRRGKALLPTGLSFGLAERTAADGKILARPSAASINELVEKLRRARVESIAVCLLHSHVNPAHEKSVGRALRRLKVPVTLSQQLSPEPGEYERSSTAVANAFVRPRVERHLKELAQKSGSPDFRVMQSSGGCLGVETVSREPVRSMLSGPAGGVAAAFEVIRAAGLQRAVTLDMGGTSTDVALLDGAIPVRTTTIIAGIPLRCPAVDIHTVGAGGGSIASVDAGGALKVGPASAGADPGPACYGRGREPTVTDANAVLGRLTGDGLLGGDMPLDLSAARRVMAELGKCMSGLSPERAAEGVLRVVEANMERAIRRITIERGQDPRGATLVSFGGAAGLHACAVADSLQMSSVLLPCNPGLLSASGVLEGTFSRDLRASLSLVDPGLKELRRRCLELENQAGDELLLQGCRASRVRMTRSVGLRYLGQSTEIEVPLKAGFRAAFDREHARLFHYHDSSRPVEACALHVTAAETARRPRRKAPAPVIRSKTATTTARLRVYLEGKYRTLPLYRRDDLRAGARFRGPALVTEYSSTSLVAAGWTARVDAENNLRLETDGG